MMPLLQKTLLIILFFIAPFTLHADNEEEVEQWITPILIDTFSLDYRFQPADDIELRKNYDDNAWNALVMFLGGYVNEVKEQQLTLHPEFVEEPHVVNSGIVKSGIFSGVRYWQVETIMTLPEIHITIAFSLIVIETSQTSHGHYLIQNINMIKQENE